MAGEWKNRGIFCIETVWFGNEDRTSIRPMLEFLESAYTQVPFIHGDAVSLDEFKYHLVRWMVTEPSEYPILYLGYHGESGNISLIDDQVSYDFETKIEFGEISQFLAGKCKNRVVHFASCGTLDVSTKEAESFLEETGASSVSGYRDDVNWIESMAFELLFLERMQRSGRKSLTPKVMKKCRDDITQMSPDSELSKHLGFNMWVAE